MDRVLAFRETVGESSLGVTDVQEATTGTTFTVDEFRGDAYEPWPHLKGHHSETIQQL